MLDLLRDDGLVPDVFSYNTALAAACAAEDLPAALQLLREASPLCLTQSLVQTFSQLFHPCARQVLSCLVLNLGSRFVSVVRFGPLWAPHASRHPLGVAQDLPAALQLLREASPFRAYLWYFTVFLFPS